MYTPWSFMIQRLESQPSLPHRDAHSLYLFSTEESVFAVYLAGKDRVYQRGEDGTWSALEGLILPDRFWDYRATLVPDEYANGCM